jgi:hypothetical protein
MRGIFEQYQAEGCLCVSQCVRGHNHPHAWSSLRGVIGVVYREEADTLPPRRF